MTVEYITKDRLVSYYNQTRIIKGLGAQVKNILEIGIFNSLLSELLTRSGYYITTADVDSELKPDILLDLSTDFDLPKDKFDAIVLFQVLEHIPYEYFEKALVRLADSTKKFIVISLPYYSNYFTIQFKGTAVLRPRHIFFQIPRFWSSTPLTSDHCWEIGLKGYPKERIVNSIKNTGLKIRREFQDPVHPYHYFFVLEKDPALS